jgi:hypothetical protein
MLHAGLDLSRRRLDFCLLDEGGERVEVGVAPPDGDGLAGAGSSCGMAGGGVRGDRVDDRRAVRA